MMVHVHGFDWAIYTKRVMPAFARWLISEEEQDVYQLYLGSRCAQEDQSVPEAMQPLCAWPRAKEFVHQLPRGPFARREYQKLCIAEQFLLLSDRYVYRHPPQLYRESEALRTIWGASVEQYCLPWYQQAKGLNDLPQEEQERKPGEFTMARGELLDLLQTAGLDALAQELDQSTIIREPKVLVETGPADESTHGEPAEATNENENDDPSDGPSGIFIGRLPTTLHLRGWLATQSLRAMVLFEYLACGRRSMPFGSQEGDPFGSYAGYLTPDEVRYLLSSLKNVQAPNPGEAEKDYQDFRQKHNKGAVSFRLIDEVLPAHVHEFLQAIQEAAEQQLGLICTIG